MHVTVDKFTGVTGSEQCGHTVTSSFWMVTVPIENTYSIMYASQLMTSPNFAALQFHPSSNQFRNETLNGLRMWSKVHN